MKNHYKKSKKEKNKKIVTQSLKEQKEWEEFLEYANYFYPKDGMRDVYNGENLSYEEYLRAIFNSKNCHRTSFEYCYYNCIGCSFKGEIEKISKDKILFKRIDVLGMLYDGTFHEDKEDHVWMNAEPFAEYKKDDAVEFYAEIYRYLKTGHGKQIDFGIINPYNIQQIDLYQLPSDEFLLNQAINALVCEVCMFNNHCNGIFCLANDEWKNGMKEMLLAVSGELPEDINDINTTEQIAKNKDIAS